MEVKLNVRNIDLRDAQEKVDNNLRQIRKMSRKVVLAYAGLLGMAYDESRALFQQGKSTLEQAGERGEILEAEATRRVNRVRASVKNQLRKAEAQVENLQGKMKSRVQRTEAKVEYDLEAQVQQMIERLGIPSRDRINKLSAEIEALNKKIDLQLGARQEITVQAEAAVVTPPLADYNKMTAKEIIALLDTLTVDDWIEIKRYEEAHERRVTLLREVNRRLEEMPIFGYDLLSVEELEAQLSNLSAEQLAYLAEYEANHGNRPMLLQAINRELEARRQVVA